MSTANSFTEKLNPPTDNLYKFIAIFSLILTPILPTFILSLIISEAIPLPEAIVSYSSASRAVKLYLFGTMFLSFVPVLSGYAAFVLWYRRLQVHKDKILLLESLKAQQEIETQFPEKTKHLKLKSQKKLSSHIINDSRFMWLFKTLDRIILIIKKFFHFTWKSLNNPITFIAFIVSAVFLGLLLIILGVFLALKEDDGEYSYNGFTAPAPVAPAPVPYISFSDESEHLNEEINESIVEKLESVFSNFEENKSVMELFNYSSDGYYSGTDYVSFIYRLRSSFFITELRELSPVPIFIKKPHSESGFSEDTFNLDSRDHFGHYNPEFLNWSGNILNTLLGRPLFCYVTNFYYEKTIKEDVQNFLFYHKIMTSYQYAIEVQNLKEHYLSQLESGTLPHILEEQLKLPDGSKPVFLTSEFPEGTNYPRKDIVAFWIRRMCDGTASHFLEIFSKVEEAYAEY